MIAALAAQVRTGQVRATDLVEALLPRLERQGRALRAVSRVLAERARAEAAAVDALVATGHDPGPLAGVPYAVKDLFDVAGLPTTAGSAVHAGAPPASDDALAIRRLRAAGAVLVATCTMDEFAYGFATINAHSGTCANPHDPSRLAGGSSGGSAAVVAAGLVPFALGSDTNGSIRVPASLTGLYGIKPTHGALPVAGTFPFAESFDDIGPFATSAADCALVWQALSLREAEPLAPHADIAVARLGGRFAANCDPAQAAAMAAIAPGAPVLDLPGIARARSAAFLITAAEGGALHRATLAQDPLAYDPQVRDRLLAGALLPPQVKAEAEAFRAAFLADWARWTAPYDVLLAPATPCVAPPIADPVILIDGEPRPARADLGIHTQPITFTACPSLAVPLRRPGALPLGLQLIGRPGGEATLLAFAADLEQRGLIGSTLPVMEEPV